MRAYADTSFIVSLYIPEAPRSEKAIAYMEEFREALPYTPQHRLEVRNAVRLRVWSKRLTVIDRARAFREIEADLDSELFLIHRSIDHTNAYRHAEKIGATHNESIGARSSDLFHVAVALELGFKRFLTFDQKQLELARSVGLKTDLE
jgi:predicted nucleic acid-binding protein